jgi:putative transposase
MDWRMRGGRRKAFNTPGHAHELTFSCYRRFPFLKAERTCQWLAEALEQARQKHDFALWAYVFMPEHVHLILNPRRPHYDLGKIAAGIKLPVARRAIHFLQANNSPWLAKLTRQRGQRSERLFWQTGGGYDRNITCGKTLLPMIDYLHNNPVRRGLVERARDWKWSSAAAMEGSQSPILIDAIPWDWLADA